jgi:ABC-2 type transport system ATP-binding protein
LRIKQQWTTSPASPKRRTLWLLGPNGAGKTTIISILSGLIEPDSGTAKINGYNV